MIMDQTGRIAENVYLTGSAGLPAYVVDGELPVIVDAGIAFMGSLYIRHIREILGSRQPRYLLLTHSHFDHCGAAAALLDAFPGLAILASQRTAEVVARKNALALMKQLSLAAADMAPSQGILEHASREFREFAVHRTLAAGDRLVIADGMTIEVLETPGHTRDSLSYHIPEQRLLFTGEAAGIQDQTGYIYSEWLVSPLLYYQSLCGLADLQPQGVFTGHNYAFTGSDAADFLQRAVVQHGHYYKLVAEQLKAESGNIERVMENIRKIEYDPKPNPKQAEPAYLINLAAKIRSVQRQIRSEEETAA